MKNTAIIVMDLKHVPIIDGPKTIFTLEHQKFTQIDDTKIIKIPSYIMFGDDVVNLFVHLNTKLPQKPEFQNMLQFVYFSHMVAFYISQQDYSEVIFEDDDLREKVLLQFDNKKRYTGKTSLV